LKTVDRGYVFAFRPPLTAQADGPHDGPQGGDERDDQAEQMEIVPISMTMIENGQGDEEEGKGGP
jgi:hypothetical protein